MGVLNQPVVNGMVLALGFAIAMLMLSRRSEPAWLRYIAVVVAVACGLGIYLTHTRAAWLRGAAVLIIGASLARGYRTGFVAALGAVVSIIAINWSTFTSTDREAGGVASETEVDDRLNTIQTALWAAAQKPLTGWGIGRFPAVNTYHHQQWSDTPWFRGHGIVAHETEIGIVAELGVIGLALWISILALVAYRLWNAYRTCRTTICAASRWRSRRSWQLRSTSAPGLPWTCGFSISRRPPFSCLPESRSAGPIGTSAVRRLRVATSLTACSRDMRECSGIMGEHRIERCIATYVRLPSAGELRGNRICRGDCGSGSHQIAPSGDDALL